MTNKPDWDNQDVTPASAVSLFADRGAHYVFLACAAALIFLGRASALSLSNYDDAYYAQKAKEMLANGGYWIVNYHGHLATDNSPLPFWVMALSFRLFGVSSYAAVLPSALFAVATVLLTYRLCEELYPEDRWTAFAAAFILLFPGFFVENGRRAMVDMALAFFTLAALFCFLKGLQAPRIFLLFGAFTGLGMMTKSVLGIFPLVIAAAYFLLGRRARGILNAWFLAGAAGALALGGAWYAVNWWSQGDRFVQGYLDKLILLKVRQAPGAFSNHLGYLQALLKNYWPWLPVTILGILAMGKKAARENDRQSLFLLLWALVPIFCMSLASSQMFRYILYVFPALAIITAKTSADRLTETTKVKLYPVMAGFLLLVILFINATPFQIKNSVTLSPQSVGIRHLAPYVRLNTPENEAVVNFRLSAWNPRNALMFYGDRYLSDPVTDAADISDQAIVRPQTTWLAAKHEFDNLAKAYPGLFYLIQSYGEYAYFTTGRNRANVRYDLPRGGDIP